MKQRWKKIASLMLVTICAFSLTACGKKKKQLLISRLPMIW